jgi:hypothetical protein
MQDLAETIVAVLNAVQTPPGVEEIKAKLRDDSYLTDKTKFFTNEELRVIHFNVAFFSEEELKRIPNVFRLNESDSSRFCARAVMQEFRRGCLSSNQQGFIVTLLERQLLIEEGHKCKAVQKRNKKKCTQLRREGSMCCGHHTEFELQFL